MRVCLRTSRSVVIHNYWKTYFWQLCFIPLLIADALLLLTGQWSTTSSVIKGLLHATFSPLSWKMGVVRQRCVLALKEQGGTIEWERGEMDTPGGDLHSTACTFLYFFFVFKVYNPPNILYYCTHEVVIEVVINRTSWRTENRAPCCAKWFTPKVKYNVASHEANQALHNTHTYPHIHTYYVMSVDVSDSQFLLLGTARKKSSSCPNVTPLTHNFLSNMARQMTLRRDDVFVSYRDCMVITIFVLKQY